MFKSILRINFTLTINEIMHGVKFLFIKLHNNTTCRHLMM